jgi:hypothetical protein
MVAIVIGLIVTDSVSTVCENQRQFRHSERFVNETVAGFAGEPDYRR